MLHAATTSSPSLHARAIVRHHGDHCVLGGVDLERTQPGIIGLLGANGAGKTTLLRILAQLTELDSGSLAICGVDVEHADSPPARRLVGWAPHEPLAWREQSIEQNLYQAGRLAGLSRHAARSCTVAALELWGLTARRSAPVRTLSRGWAQRYSLARADLLGPPILLLDEPTTGLDHAARHQLEDALEAWRRDRIVVVASHERDWLTERSDQVLDLDTCARVGSP